VAPHPFTGRQWETIVLLAEGLTLDAIAVSLGVTRSGVRTTLWEARKRTGAESDAGLIAECYEQGWLATKPALLEHREEVEEWPKVTPAQRAYLDVFDRMLKTRYGSEAERRTRLEMRYMLGAICIEKDIHIPGSQPVLALAA
jgi:DNA-binding CsgD family transcriptional regulator